MTARCRVSCRPAVDDERPIYVSEAAESTGRRWINELPPPRDSSNYTMTLVWRGRYSSDARYADEWRRPAKPWKPLRRPCTTTNHCVDDVYHNNRYSIHASRKTRISIHDSRFSHPIICLVNSEHANRKALFWSPILAIRIFWQIGVEVSAFEKRFLINVSLGKFATSGKFWKIISQPLG